MSPMIRPLRVYPRVGGGTAYANGDYLIYMGLSPRGRGNRELLPGHERIDGSIPAWAGEPKSQSGQTMAWPVYPRVGGGTQISEWADYGVAGLSPRGRGNPNLRVGRLWRGRSIPAWAGEPKSQSGQTMAWPVYPRVGGGT